MINRINFIVGCVGVAVSFFFKDVELRTNLLFGSLAFVMAGIVGFIVFICENRNNWGIYKTLFFKRNESVRVTVAYLFRIELNGKYMLIKRHKNDNNIGYQPVGGAYKYWKDENRDNFEKLGVRPCSCVPRDNDTEDDLRIIINKRKNLTEFLKWFHKRKDRELDPYREFKEELVKPGFLSAESFEDIDYAYVDNNIEGVLKSPVYNVDEVRYADIVDLKLRGDSQKQELIELENKTDEIIFVTPDEIHRGKTDGGVPILPHSFKILP